MLDKLGPPFAFTLWVSARLLLVHGSTVDHTVNPEIKFFVDTLRHMGKFWKVAERYSTILQRVLNEYFDYKKSSTTAIPDAMGTKQSTPSSVKILADMRRCAFDLDFLISRQPGNATPRTTTHPVSRDPGVNELEYLDVFGFFNVPRIPILPSQMSLDGLDVVQEGANNNASTGMDQNTDVGVSVSDLPGSQAEGAASAATVNEFNITNYMVPTPETDWLFQAA